MAFRFMVVIALMMLLISCSKLTMKNYEQLKTGMNYEDVTSIIGTPDSCDEQLGTRSCIWGEAEASNIKASFIQDKAIFFSHKQLN